METRREKADRQDLIEALRVRLAAAKKAPRGVVMSRVLLEAVLEELERSEDAGD